MNLLHRWICRSAWWRRHVEAELLPWALKDVVLGDRVLEVGPGPGLTTNYIVQKTRRLTALEIDPQLANGLSKRFVDCNVDIIEGDATVMPFPEAQFSAVASFTMLHHIPSTELQNRMLSEVLRVLRPGGTFVGTDSVWGPVFALAHIGDTMVLSDPAKFGDRLERVGFIDIEVARGSRAFRFRSSKPSNPVKAIS